MAGAGMATFTLHRAAEAEVCNIGIGRGGAVHSITSCYDIITLKMMPTAARGGSRCQDGSFVPRPARRDHSQGNASLSPGRPAALAWPKGPRSARRIDPAQPMDSPGSHR